MNMPVASIYSIAPDLYRISVAMPPEFIQGGFSFNQYLHYLEEAEALCGRLAMLKQGRVVALAQTSELLKAASSNVLRFKIDRELPLALAQQARITGRIVQFPAHDANEIEQYLAAVRQAGLVAEDVEIRKADLEDVFLEVMAEKVGVAA